MNSLQFRTGIALFFTLIASVLFAGGQDELDSISYDSVEIIDIQVPDWDVLISGTSNGSRMEANFKGYTNQQYTIREDQRGSRVTIEIIKKPKLDIFNMQNPILELTLPQDIELSVNSGSGDIRITDKLSGTISMRTGSGDIQASDIQGDLNLVTGSGDITIQKSRGELSVNVGSGDIRLGSVEGLLSLASGSGDITINSAVASLEAKTGSGDIRISKFTPYGAARFACSSGDISIELLGDLNLYSFDARTASGDIRIFNQRSDNRFQGGTGEINITMVSASGDIRVY